MCSKRMTSRFYTDVTVRRVYELWVHNKKKALPGETSLLRKVAPSIQTCSSGTYPYRNDARSNRSSWKNNFPSLSILLVPKYMQKGLDRQPLNPNIAHAFFRKMCFKYKQVSLHKHSSTLLKGRDCLYNQFNINYIANSTGIRFPEERIRNSPASEFTWWPAALGWPVENPGVVGMVSVCFGADHLSVGVFLLPCIVLIW